MEDDSSHNFVAILETDYIVNITCDYDYVPPAIEYIESLGAFGIVFVTLGTILMAVTLYLAIDASYTVVFTKESKAWKKNLLLILSVYPVTSLCSLVALAIPRSQLLSEAITQISLTIGLYRLYLLLIDVGRREVKKSPSLRLRVGPCCCWPCLPFPDLEMSPTNLSWLQVIVLQLPIVQTLVYCVFVFMSVEDPSLTTRYGIFLQPLSITSILLGLYGLSITMKSLQEVNSGLNLHHKTVVVQMVLLFSKLQGFVVKSLPKTGLFPCKPPITPQIYANFTYNALMLIEMLFLCYAARLIYGDNDKHADVEGSFAIATTGNNSSSNNNDRVTREDANNPETIHNRDKRNCVKTSENNFPTNNKLASVTA